MDRHVIIGAGAVGTLTAQRPAEHGHEVRIITRSGSGPDAPGIERVAADATDVDALARLAEDATAIYNCANPPSYASWAEVWPPLAASILGAAERSGAVLVTTGNLHGYAPGTGVMTETTPLDTPTKKGRIRNRMWADALGAHETGRARVTEVRASDFFGPHGGNAHLGERFIPKVLAGKRLTHIADPDVPHSWTYLPDVAAALVTAATDERAWGRAWHVPTNPPRTYRQMAEQAAAIAGAPAPKISTLPRPLMSILGVAMADIRELAEVRYQFSEPFVLDSTLATATFGLTPTPLDEALATTVEWWRRRA
ncbi:MAG: NAD-dependent epimerase/dehydratase family protein [Acidimicrobiia bacterium]|nr:NAD-dependent epimerase/dehydratase family protein [Acidimicrobiia bacterium]